MKLGVYTVEKTLFDGEAKKIVLGTTSGEITILDHHIPLISKLSPGTIRIIGHDSRDVLLRVSGGIIEVRPKSEVVILAQGDH